MASHYALAAEYVEDTQGRETRGFHRAGDEISTDDEDDPEVSCRG